MAVSERRLRAPSAGTSVGSASTLPHGYYYYYQQQQQRRGAHATRHAMGLASPATSVIPQGVGAPPPPGMDAGRRGKLMCIKHKAMGGALVDEVCRHLNLLEADYFGLEFLDCFGNHCWLERDKPILRQITHCQSDARFYFVVKFYVPDPHDLEEEYTRYLFALQIKRDLASGHFVCAEPTAALMAAYVVQAECGDFVPDDYPDHTYLSGARLVPGQTGEFEAMVMHHHQQLVGMSPAEADLALLEAARRCEFYGVKFHPARDVEGTPVNVSVLHMGIRVFHHLTCASTFSWAKIRKISFKRKKFLIKLHPESYQYYKDTIEFAFDTRDEAKAFWKKCVEHHAFFRCADIQAGGRQFTGAHGQTAFLTKGSSFRYHGRTQRQMIEYVRDHNKRREPFTRPLYSSTGTMGRSGVHTPAMMGSSSTRSLGGGPGAGAGPSGAVSHSTPAVGPQTHRGRQRHVEPHQQQQAAAHVHQPPASSHPHTLTRPAQSRPLPVAEVVAAVDELPLYSSAPHVGSAPGQQLRTPTSPPMMEPSTSVGGGGYMMVCSNSEHESMIAGGSPVVVQQAAGTLGRPGRPHPAGLLRRPIPPSDDADAAVASTSHAYAPVDRQGGRPHSARRRPVVTPQLPSSRQPGTYDNCLPETADYRRQAATANDGDNVSQDSYQVSEVAEAEQEGETVDTEGAGATSSASAQSPPAGTPVAAGHVHVTDRRQPAVETVTTHVAAAVPSSQANYYGMRSVKSASAKIRELPHTPAAAPQVQMAAGGGRERPHVIANGTSQIVEVTERISSPKTYGATGPLPGRVVTRSTAVVTPSGIRPMVQPIVQGAKPAVPPKPARLVKVQAQSLEESIEEMATDEEETEKAGTTPVISPQEVQSTASAIQPAPATTPQQSSKGAKAAGAQPSTSAVSSPTASTSARDPPATADSPSTGEPPAIHIQSEDRPEIQHRLLLNGDVPYVLHMRHVQAAAAAASPAKRDDQAEFSTFKEPASRPTVKKAVAAISSQPTSPTQTAGGAQPSSSGAGKKSAAGRTASASAGARMSRADKHDKHTSGAITAEEVFKELTRRKSLDLVARRRLPSPNNFSSQDHSVSPTTPDTGNIMDYVLRRRTQSQDRMQVLQKAAGEASADGNGRQRSDPRRKTQPVKLAAHDVDRSPTAAGPPQPPPKPSLSSFGRPAGTAKSITGSSSQPELGTVPQGESADYASTEELAPAADTPEDSLPPPPPPLQSAAGVVAEPARPRGIKEEADLMWTDF